MTITGGARKERVLQAEEILVSATTTIMSKMVKIVNKGSVLRALAGTVGWEVRVGGRLGGGGKR